MKLKHCFIVLFLFLTNAIYSQGYFTLSGVITNAQTGQTLEGVDIVIKDELTGTISNYKGAYILYLNKGSYSINFSSSDFKTEKLDLILTDNQVKMVALTPKGKLITKAKKSSKKPILLKPSENEIVSANSPSTPDKKK